MMRIRQRKLMFALLALLLVLAACKGESPTAPNPTPGGGGTTPPGGGVTPPVGATIVLTVLNPTPLVASTSTITATVTVNGTPVVDGTAVEFATDFGSFSLSNPALVSLIKTTVNGVASVTLTAPSPGTATVTAVVNNVSKQTQIKFQAQTVPITPPSTNPTITSISPTQGRPAGGDAITITGSNFRQTVRVIFDFGGGVLKDAFVTTVSPTVITAVTPLVDVGTGQQKQATIIVVDEAGTPNEARVSSAANAFTFQAEVLTPSITTLLPSSGPIDGGTRVTIVGDAFQAPVQVFFGSQDAVVVSVLFKQIIVISPTARDTTGNGSGTVTGPVDVKVLNINSNKFATLTGGFRYTPKMQITAAGPTIGPYTGGTRVTIDGIGFTSPVAVGIAGVAAQPISVNGTEVIAITSPALVTACTDITGPIQVTNVDNGDSATGPTFTYRVAKPVIVGINPSTQTAGQTITVDVVNGQVGANTFTIGDKNVFPTATSFNAATGITSYTITLPLNFTFPSGTCTLMGGLMGTAPQPITVSVTLTNTQTTCTASAANALTINPVNPACQVPPPSAAVTSPASGCVVFPATPNGTPAAPLTITVANTAPAGSQTLNVTLSSISGANAGDFSITPGSFSNIPGGGNRNFTVNFTPGAVGNRNATATFTTNDPNNPTLTVCLTGSGM